MLTFKKYPKRMINEDIRLINAFAEVAALVLPRQSHLGGGSYCLLEEYVVLECMSGTLTLCSLLISIRFTLQYYYVGR